jgi:hypothetical protein
MENKILTDPEARPENNLLENAMGKHYRIYAEFVNTTNELNLVPEWNYYKDEKSWLCKFLSRKKNMCWLSVWNTGFKLTFYFTEKTIDGVYELNIHDELKETIRGTKPVGKFHPAIIQVKDKKNMGDGIKILEYKMKLK